MTINQLLNDGTETILLIKCAADFTQKYNVINQQNLFDWTQQGLQEY